MVFSRWTNFCYCILFLLLNDGRLCWGWFLCLNALSIFSVWDSLYMLSYIFLLSGLAHIYDWLLRCWLLLISLRLFLWILWYCIFWHKQRRTWLQIFISTIYDNRLLCVFLSFSLVRLSVQNLFRIHFFPDLWSFFPDLILILSFTVFFKWRTYLIQFALEVFLLFFFYAFAFIFLSLGLWCLSLTVTRLIYAFWDNCRSVACLLYIFFCLLLICIWSYAWCCFGFRCFNLSRCYFSLYTVIRLWLKLEILCLLLYALSCLALSRLSLILLCAWMRYFCHFK